MTRSHHEAMRYELATATNITSAATVPAFFDWKDNEDLAACLDRLCTQITGATHREFEDDGPDGPKRFVASCDAVTGAGDGKINSEAAYGVLVRQHDTGRQVELVKLFDVNWVNGTATTPAADTRQPKLAKSLTLTSTGALEAMTGGGVEPRPYPDNGVAVAAGAGVCYVLTDVGPLRAIVRVFRNSGGSATGGAHPRSARWK